jgi:hypothetical protein
VTWTDERDLIFTLCRDPRTSCPDVFTAEYCYIDESDTLRMAFGSYKDVYRTEPTISIDTVLD